MDFVQWHESHKPCADSGTFSFVSPGQSLLPFNLTSFCEKRKKKKKAQANRRRGSAAQNVTTHIAAGPDK